MRSSSSTSKPWRSAQRVVHAQEHLGPVLGVGAALAGLDRHQGVALVVLAGEQGAQLELVEAAAEGGDRLGDLGLLALVLLAGQLGERLGVLELLGELVVAASRSAVTADSSPVTLRAASGSSQRSGRAASVSSCGRRLAQLVDAEVLRGPRRGGRAAPSGRRRSHARSGSPAVAQLELLAAAARAGRVAGRLVPLALHHRGVDRRPRSGSAAAASGRRRPGGGRHAAAGGGLVGRRVREVLHRRLGPSAGRRRRVGPVGAARRRVGVDGRASGCRRARRR